MIEKRAVRALPFILGRLNPGVEGRSMCHLASVIALTVFAQVSLSSVAHSQEALSDVDYSQAKRMMARGKWQEAASQLEPLYRTTRGVPELAHDYARVLFYLGRSAEAIAVLRETYDRERGARPQTQKLWRLLSRQFFSHEVAQEMQHAIALMSERRYREAREKMKVPQQREPNNLEVWLRAGQARVMEADPRAAMEPLKRAREIYPFEPEISLWMGRALFLTGLVGPAVDELTRAREGLPRSETAVIWLAEALAARGERDQAIELLSSSLTQEIFHLQAGLMAATLKLAGATKKGPQSIAAQKLVQTVISRIEEYTPSKRRSSESDLGVDLRNPTQLRIEAEALFKRIDALPAQLPETKPLGTG